MNDIYILAIESSCDETSASIVKNGKEDIATVINSQIDIHKLYGGVVPEVASRLHLENITLVLDEVLKKSNMKVEDMSAIAVTYSPGLLGSLLVGLESAKMLSLVYNKPFIKVNHMMGHICANNIGHDLEYPLLSLVISGGHTDLIYMENENSFKYVGSTLDDAVGECFDKVARILDMPYPGGPNVERLALEGKDVVKMPKLLNDDSFNFSFSGIKSHVNNLVHNAKQRGEKVNKADVACSFQKAVTDSLVSKTLKAILKLNVKNLSIAGGVASNTFIRNALINMCEENGVKVFVPDKKYCTDNATMIGAAAYILYKNDQFSDLSVNASSHEELNVKDIC
jgi:N6-L-threonylcarbamoyladenine synthase